MPNNRKSKSSGISSVGIMIIAIVCLMIAALMMFLPNIRVPESFKILSANEIFFHSLGRDYPGIWPVFIGYMLIFLSGIATLVMSLPVVKYSWKFERNVFIGLSVAEFVGGVLVACINLFYASICHSTLSLLVMSAGPYIAIFFTAAALVCNYFVLKKDRV